MNQTFQQIKDLVNETEEDLNKFLEKNNKSAGVRVRKKMQEVKKLAQEIRIDILGKINK